MWDTSHLQIFPHCHHNKILPKDPQLKSRIKTEQSKTIWQWVVAGANIYQSCYCDRFKSSIKQLNGLVLESITPDEFHLVEIIDQNSNKSFDLTKKRHTEIWWTDKQEEKNTSYTNITDKKEMGY